jgi:transcriptional regulator with XRE-family HTH domain
MSSIGEILKNNRQSKGVSLEDMASIMKIRQKYIKAIENDDVAIAELSEAYRIGYIRNISSFLGLDVNDIIEKYKLENNNSVNKNNEVAHNNLAMQVDFSSNKLILAISVILSVIFFIFYFYSGNVISDSKISNELFKDHVQKIEDKNLIAVNSYNNGRYVLLAKNKVVVKIIDSKGTLSANLLMSPGETYFLSEIEDVILQSSDLNAIEVYDSITSKIQNIKINSIID